jgi:single-strand DNA-binding protein
VAWDKLGQNCAKHLSKGRQVYIEGKIQSRAYDDKDGAKRYVTEIIANDVQFLGKKSNSDSRNDIPPVGDNDIPF